MVVDVAIVGAGFAGLGAAIRLDRAGRHDFVILEAADRVGGTWRDNRYPGAACDIPSRLYSLSFAPKTDWSARYAQQPEIQAYLEGLVDDQGLRERLKLGAELTEARWDGSHWQLTLADGSAITARYVVYGIGALRIPRYPTIPGRERFRGIQMHSARWTDTALDGLRVGVVGTGASAVQVVPAIADRVGALTVFQRTPPWVLDRVDRDYGPVERALVQHVPGLATALRWRRYWIHERKYPLFFGPLHPLTRALEPLLHWQIRRRVGEPLAERLLPDYRMGCKRLLVADGWYETLTRPHVDVVTEPITEVVQDGVIVDGDHRPLDALLWCTGFHVDDPLGHLEVYGVDGVSLREAWGARPHALRGIQVPGFPNSFLLLGPNTALGHNSVVIMIEAQIRYLLDALDHADANGPIEARPEALAAWMERVDRRHRSRVWASGCASWYLGADQANFTIYPGSTARYVLETRKVRPDEVRFLDAPTQTA